MRADVNQLTTIAAAPPRTRRNRRSWWLRQLHSWHWVTAAISLIGMLLFAITGLTLNHASSIAGAPVTTAKTGTLPPPLRRLLTGSGAADRPLPRPVAAAVTRATGLDAAEKPGEWSDGEVYVALPRPGGDAWVSIDKETGAITSELTTRGWISYLNDLHKGRNAGSAWFWFIDLFAVACVLFTLTGLLLLQLHARHRPSTWPLVGAGVAVPAVIAIWLIH